MSESIDHLNIFLAREDLHAEAARISPRLAELFASLAFVLSSVGEEWKAEQQQPLGRLFKFLEYTPQFNSGSICRLCDDKVKYYRCYDCEINNRCCFCEKCFSDPQHAGHEFKIMTSKVNYCDCGNEEYARRQHFCREHREREGGEGRGSKVDARQRDLFSSEMEFLLFVGLHANREGGMDKSKRAHVIAFKTLQILTQQCSNSYTYQQITADLLLRSFRLPKAGSDTILHHLMWEEWLSDPVKANLAKLLSHVYTCKQVRKSILVEYFRMHASEQRFVAWVDPITQMDSQYFLEGSLILKLLKGKIIPPLIFNYKFTQPEAAANSFIQLYRAYRIMHESPKFKEILEETLRVVDFSRFFAFGLIDRESRGSLKVVTNYYLVFLKLIVQRLQQFQDRGAAQSKIIHQCYRYIKTKEEIYSFSAERTMGWMIFSHYNWNIGELAGYGVSQIMKLLGEESEEQLQETIGKMLNNYCNIFRIQNYNDYRQLTSQKSELNSNNQVIISIDYTTVRIIVTFLQVLHRERDAEGVPLRNMQVGKHSILEKWIQLFRTEKAKKDSVTDPQAKAQINSLMDTGLFVKLDDQIAGVTIELVATVNNMLFACESDICETVLANSMGKAQSEKVMKIYQEFSWLHPNKSKYEFKNYVDGVIFNQPLIKEFIIAKNEGEKVEQYESNLTYCSRYFADEITDDTSQRFLKKLQSCGKGNALTRFLFSDPMITQLIKYTELFIKLITSSFDLKEATTINVTFNLLIECLVVIFMETRNERLKRMIFKIHDTPVLKDNYTDYTVIIIQILMNHFNQKDKEAEDEIRRKEAAKMKRNLKMKQIKEKQQKFLESHCSSKVQQKVQENIDQCIICKMPSVEGRQLSYLCNIRFSNTLTRSILSSDCVLMVITTCGHKIHENCLASNIDERDEYGTNYHCFLCKHLSNLRIPIHLPPQKIDTFLQYFLTIVSLEISSNSVLNGKTEQYASIGNLSKLLYDNIVLSIFLYFFSLSKFYNAYILPIVQAEINVLKWLKQSFAVPRAVDFSGKDHRIRLIQNKVNSILGTVGRSDQLMQNEQNDQVDQLFLKIFNPASAITQEIRKIQRFNFLKLPNDLRTLTRQMGKCRFCNKLNNKMVLCFLCTFKCCSDCNGQINRHIDIHLGTGVLIDVQNGRFCYRFRNIQVQSNSLYVNYIGEEYTDDGELPPRGEFQLSQERVQKLIDEILQDEIQNRVEESVRHAEIPACNTQ